MRKWCYQNYVKITNCLFNTIKIILKFKDIIASKDFRNSIRENGDIFLELKMVIMSTIGVVASIT